MSPAYSSMTENPNRNIQKDISEIYTLQKDFEILKKNVAKNFIHRKIRKSGKKKREKYYDQKEQV